MKAKIKTLTLTALALGIITLPLRAQEEPDRAELERRLRELRREMREVQRQLLRQQVDVRAFSRSLAPVLAFGTNRVRLGVTVQTQADEETDAIGAVLQAVAEDSPAAEAGLESGDIITSFNGEPLTGRHPSAGWRESEPARKLIDLVGEMKEGDEVTIEYQRDGRTYTTTATLRVVEPDAEWFSLGVPDADVVTPETFEWSTPRRLGVALAPEGNMITLFAGPWSDVELVRLNEDLGRYFGTSEGLLVIRVPEDEEMNLMGGDVILTIGGREALTPSRALRILRSYEPGEEIELEIMRDRNRMTVTMTVPESDNHFGIMRQRREF